MINRITIEEYISNRTSAPLVDVRTPSEYAKGHIPGALSIPLFSDEERISVGTTYKQQGRENAILLGFDLVGSKWSDFIRKAIEMAPDKKIFVHCWRGGMRSGAMAWAFDFYGFEVAVIEGGYKAWRNWALQQFEKEYDLWILGGMTGSHKTAILKEIAKTKEQVIDLEGMAHHQGSAFGSMGKWTQPTQEHFENELALILYDMDINRKIWVEDESRTIGKVAVPHLFWRQMQSKTLIEVRIEREKRLDFLTEEYGVLDKDFLIEKTEQIKKRLGYDRAKIAIDAIHAGEMRTFVGLVLDYYDKAYQGCIDRRQEDTIFPIQIDYQNPSKSAEAILQFITKI